MMKTYPISEKLCLELRAYLTTRPWGEVNNLIVGLTQQLVAAEETAQQKAAAEPLAKANGKDGIEQSTNAQ